MRLILLSKEKLEDLKQKEHKEEKEKKNPNCNTIKTTSTALTSKISLTPLNFLPMPHLQISLTSRITPLNLPLPYSSHSLITHLIHRHQHHHQTHTHASAPSPHHASSSPSSFSFIISLSRCHASPPPASLLHPSASSSPS